VEVIYLQQALEDLKYWKKSGNKSIQNRISLLLKSLEETPFEGIGKPEGLKYHHSGKWSRRITKADRIIYEIEDEKIFIYSLKGHYER
jgi:toxin YoeB